MRFLWRHKPGGKLKIPGRPPTPDREGRDRIVAGIPPRVLLFEREGHDGVYETDDPWECAAIRQTVAWNRRDIIEGMPAHALAGPYGGHDYGGMRPQAVARPRAIEEALKDPLPYFEEPETFEDLLAVL